MQVPNFDRLGRPKTVYFTWDYYTSISVAESALQIGSKDPAGPFASPSDRADINVTGISYTYVGIVPGGTGSELTTTNSPFVISVNPLGP